MEIVREEVKEECGYLAPLESFTKIVTFPESVGFSGFYNGGQNIPYSLRLSGGTKSLFCVEVGNKDKVGPGGGLEEEGEMIRVVEMSVSEAREYISR